MRTVVHIGCMKTGTTTLQKYLFRKLDSVRYIGKYNDTGYPTKQTFNAIRMNGDVEAEKERWEEVSAEAEAAGETLLYSVEGFVHSHLAEQDLIARRTKEVVGDAVILLTIRNQVDIAESQYFNFVGKGYDESFETFMQDGIDLLEYTPEDESDISTVNVYRRQPGLIWSIWQFDKLVDIWEEHFESVAVLPLEAWRDDPGGTIETLAETLDVDSSEVYIPEKKARSRTSNLRLAGIKLSHLPVVGRVLKSGFLPRQLDRFVSDRHLNVELTAEQRDQFTDIYGSGNQRLDEQSRFDFDEMGYPMASSATE